VKRAILFIIIGLAVGGDGLWLATHGGGARADADDKKPAADSKPAAAEDENKTTVTHDTNGNVVVGMEDEAQGNAGIVVANPAAAEFSPEVKTYGRVVDPAPIADLMIQLAAAEATFDNAHEELERAKTLKSQNNTSDRALQSALATYKENMAAAMGIRAKIQLAWGTKLADLTGNVVVPPGTERKPPPGPNPLADGDVLIRLDLPAGESLGSVPDTARVVPLGTSTQSIVAQYFDELPAVDPQTLAHGFLFYSTNSLKAGEPVTGYIPTGGESLKGVIIPREAVIRAEGKSWVYVLNSNGASFTRKEIPVDHAVENGWFVENGITSGDHVVVTGAQTILSLELSGAGFTSGRD
jgi:hypothetical protein